MVSTLHDGFGVANLGSAPGIRLHPITKALKAWVSSVCSFPIPDAMVILQTERALNLAPRIEHAPHLSPLPASGARQNGAADRVHTVEASCCCVRCQARAAHRHLA